MVRTFGKLLLEMDRPSAPKDNVLHLSVIEIYNSGIFTIIAFHRSYS